MTSGSFQKQIKSAFKERRFQDIEDIEKIDDGIESYSTTRVSKMFQWQDRSAKCIAAQGEYFEDGLSQ